VTTYNNFVGNTLGASGSNRASFLILGALGGTAYQAGNLGTPEVQYDYISPMFELMALNFVNYRLHGLEFIYEPQSTTTALDRCVFGFAADALHPLLKNSDGTQDISQRILALEDSVAFAPWERWTLNVSDSLKAEDLYVSDFIETSTNNERQYSARIANRFSSFGSIAASCSNTSTLVSQTVYGIIYARIKVEFKEFCPLISVVTGSLDYPPGKEKVKKEKEKSSSSFCKTVAMDVDKIEDKIEDIKDIEDLDLELQCIHNAKESVTRLKHKCLNLSDACHKCAACKTYES
jgi:hypothetical protein